jgi:phage N-6-adenine-methyltransferase
MARQLRRVPLVEGQEKESDKWRTPLPLFYALNQEFVFDVDLAADGENRLCAEYFGEGGTTADALLPILSWGGFRAVGFLNPPYSGGRIAPFLEKAILEAVHGFTTVALLPDTHDTNWYRLLDAAAEIRRIPHRVPYLRADGRTAAGAMFPSCVAIFRAQPGVRTPRPRIVNWDYR